MLQVTLRRSTKGQKHRGAHLAGCPASQSSDLNERIGAAVATECCNETNRPALDNKTRHSPRRIRASPTPRFPRPKPTCSRGLPSVLGQVFRPLLGPLRRPFPCSAAHRDDPSMLRSKQKCFGPPHQCSTVLPRVLGSRLLTKAILSTASAALVRGHHSVSRASACGRPVWAHRAIRCCTSWNSGHSSHARRGLCPCPGTLTLAIDRSGRGSSRHYKSHLHAPTMVQVGRPLVIAQARQHTSHFDMLIGIWPIPKCMALPPELLRQRVSARHFMIYCEDAKLPHRVHADTSSCDEIAIFNLSRELPNICGSCASVGART